MYEFLNRVDLIRSFIKKARYFDDKVLLIVHKYKEKRNLLGNREQAMSVIFDKAYE